jgi:hypothetical protein
MKIQRLFIFSMMWHHLWFRFNCFGLFKAKKINDFLLWMMFGSLFATYGIMYLLLSDNDVDRQWYWYFVSNSFQMACMSWIVLTYFRGTRNEGIATAWMINCGIDFVAQVMDLHQKIFWFSAFTKLFLAGLGFYAIYHYMKRAKKDEA